MDYHKSQISSLGSFKKDECTIVISSPKGKTKHLTLTASLANKIARWVSSNGVGVDSYIEQSCCPFCDEYSDIDYEHLEFKKGLVYQEAHCAECDARWRDNYSLQYVEKIKN